MSNSKYVYWLTSTVCFALLALVSQYAAATGDAGSVGSMAASITGSFKSVTKLITAGSYLAGLAFAVAAIMKFKQHKDNPTQIPIGTPIALILIAGAFLFLPTILGVTGSTMFGAGKGSTAGPSGIIFTSSGS